MTRMRWFIGLVSALMLATLASLLLSVLVHAQAVVIVRGNDQADSSQLTFFVPEAITAQEQQDGSQLTLVFGAPLDFDFGPLSNAPLALVSDPAYSQADGNTTVTLQLADDVVVDTTRLGGRLTLNVSPAPEPEPASTQVADAGPDADNDAETPQGQNDADPPVDQATLDAIEQMNAEAAAAATPDAEDTTDQQATETVSDPVTELNTDNLPPLLVVSMEEVPALDENGAPTGAVQHMHFDWRYRVSAAAFTRAGYLWVIFDEQAEPDLAALQPYLNDRITTAEQAQDLDQTLFRFALNGPQGVTVTAQDNRWTISLQNDQPDPVQPITMARQDVENDNFRLFIPIDNPGPHLRIMDPAVGDVLDVIPVLVPGVGAVRQREFAQFSMLPSAQGLVLLRSSDQLVVSRFSNGVAVGGVTNLAISNSPLDTDLALRRMSSDGALRPARLVDFEVWRLGPLEEFTDHRTNLLNAIARADEDKLNERRWDLARFLLGHGMATEALAVLDLMLEKNPAIATDPKYRAVRGISHYYLRDYEESARQLGARELDVEPGIYLWRALVAEAQGRNEDTLTLFERGRESIDQYEPEQVTAFRTAVVRAALATQRYDTANWQLSLLRRMELSPYLTADVDYLEGRLLQLLGEEGEALTYFRGIDEFVNRRAAAYARYAMTLAQLEVGELPVDDAIEEMERLRYSWRGDTLEQELLHELGKLYMGKEDYRHGLEIMRQAVASFEEGPNTRAMTQEMVTAFHKLFLEGEADKLPPVTALGLYYDFRELTPLGAEGDQMIRRLADRLVSVDLLDRAAELLDHQVRFRLEGSAQALIATRLAKIYMMDHRPNDAMEILRVTRQNSVPEDVMNERRLVEARVLVELGRYDEARVLIEEDTSQEAQTIRADLHWGAQNWAEVARVTQEILGDRWQDTDQPLTDVERQFLIRQVIALSLDNQRQQLDTVKARYENLMQDGLLANAFDVITSPDAYTSDELRDVVRRTAAVDTLQSFMSSYRQEFIERLPAGADNSSSQ